MRGLPKWLLLAFACLTLTVGASAQDFPTKPLNIVVPYPPASGPDLWARVLGPKLSEQFRQPVIITNIAAAAGVQAGVTVLKAPADGHTLFMGDTSVLIVASYLIKNMPYEPLKAFRPVALIGQLPYAIAASSKNNIRSLEDLIREAKANPGKLFYGSSGYGSNHHIVMEAFKQATGIQINHIPYKGGAASVLALVEGEVHVSMTSPASLGSNVTSGLARILAVTTGSRFPMLPDVPPISDTVPGFDFTSEPGIVVAAETPTKVVEKLSVAIKVALDMPDVKAGFDKVGTIPKYGDSAEYAENLRVNAAKFDKAIKFANIQPE